MKKRLRQEVPFTVENHPDDYDGFPFVTLLRFKDIHYLTIIDNSNDKKINAFVLDMCGPENIDEKVLLEIASEWYERNRDNYPISIEFSKRGLAAETQKIYKEYDIEYITRVIGPLPEFNLSDVTSVKRVKRSRLTINRSK